MPAYDFKCNSCDNRFTVTVSMKDRNKTICPVCGRQELTQLFTGINIMGSSSNNCVTPINSRFT